MDNNGYGSTDTRGLLVKISASLISLSVLLSNGIGKTSGNGMNLQVFFRHFLVVVIVLVRNISKYQQWNSTVLWY